MAAPMVALLSLSPPGSLVIPKSTNFEFANASTSATYVASVPVGYFVASGVVVLSDGRPVASASPSDVSSPIIDGSLRSVTRTYTAGLAPIALITLVIGVEYCTALPAQVTAVP